MPIRTNLLTSIIVTLVALVPLAAKANLLINGNFEGSTSRKATPPAWANVGHSEGVIAYSLFATPAYDGNYFYDVDGFGDPPGLVRDGIQQTVATTVGLTYTLIFALSSESGGTEAAMSVSIGGVVTNYCCCATWHLARWRSRL